jgi:hypothetical protein
MRIKSVPYANRCNSLALALFLAAPLAQARESSIGNGMTDTKKTVPAPVEGSRIPITVPSGIDTKSIVLTDPVLAQNKNGAASSGAPDASGTPASAGLNTSIVMKGRALDSILNCPDQKLTYIPLPPMVAGGYTEVKVNDKTGEVIASAKNWPTSSPADINKLLGNISTSIASKADTSTFSLASIFGYNHSNSQYVIDFMKYRIEPLQEINGANLGWARVGAGMRVVVNLTKDDGSASGGIWSLAASVSASRVKGTMSTELIGMDSPETTAAMPFTVDLTDGNIQKLIEALAIVKMKLYDANTTVTPMLIATVRCAADSMAVAEQRDSKAK